MNCPECRKTMMVSGDFYFCGHHEPPVIMPVSSVEEELNAEQNKLLAELPTPIALLVKEFFYEKEPYIALNRLCDSAEMITRFFAILCLSDLYQQEKDFPESLKKSLVSNLERPTFGAWINLTEDSLRLFNKKKKHFIPQLSLFWKNVWRPLLSTKQNNHEKEILPLRNQLAHGGRLQHSEAEKLLQNFTPLVEQALKELQFLTNIQMFSTDDKGIPFVSIRGLPDDSWQLKPFSLKMETLELKSNHVYLFNGKETLSLFPLQAFDRVMVWSDEGQFFKVVESSPSPLVYLRYNKNRRMLEFTALGKNSSFSQRGEDMLKAFLPIFNLQEWRDKFMALDKLDDMLPPWDHEFSDMIDEVTEGMVGRETEIHDVKTWLKSNSEVGGVVWFSGKPGVGKSALIGILAQRLKGDRKKLVIPFFFRAGDSRCHPDYFYLIATIKIGQYFNIPITLNPKDSKKEQFFKFIKELQEQQLLDEAHSIVFFIDGLDELGEKHKDFFEVPMKLKGNGLFWICSGRNEVFIHQELKNESHLWNGELSGLDGKYIRQILEEECARERYSLFERDIPLPNGEFQNPFIETILDRSQGLPLYLRLVIEDLKTGKLSFYNENKLPYGLEQYYDRILDRLKIGDMSNYLNHIFGILCWAYEPLTNNDLIDILQNELKKDFVPNWKNRLRLALEYGSVVLKRAETSDGHTGWIIYHESFRNHLRSVDSFRGTRNRGLGNMLEWCGRWDEQDFQTSSTYPLRYYAKHLYDAYFYFKELEEVNEIIQ